MARPVARWNTWGKYLSGFVALCFFLPFFGVSCNGMDVVHFSGVDLAFGLSPGGLAVDMAKEEGGKMSGGDMKMEGMDKAPVEPIAIVALVSALVVFGASTRKKKGARMLAFAFALVTLGSLGGMWVMENRKLSDAVDEQSAKDAKKNGSNAMARDIAKDIDISAGSKYGFWAATLGMLALAWLAGSAVKQGEDPPLPPEPAPAPVA